MTRPPARLNLSPDHCQAMFEHALACLPEEACGLLGGLFFDDGKVARAEQVVTVENELHSTVRFRMAPAAQLRAFQSLEEAGLDLVAFFHSHPRGPSYPSPTDLAEFAYPGVLSLILFPAPAGEWRMRAFAIDGVYSPELSYAEIPIDGQSPTEPGR